MKIGDLAMTHKGNLVVIKDIGYDKWGKAAWYDIIFSTTGYLRTGFPPEWIKKHNNKGDKNANRR